MHCGHNQCQGSTPFSEDLAMPFAIRRGFKAALSRWTDRTSKNFDADFDAIETTYFHQKPVSIQTLLKSTQFSRRELQIIYRGFKEQLVRFLSSLIHGSSASKLMWIFQLYDTEGDGVIDKTEMLKVVQSIYDLLGKHTDPPYEEASVREHMESVFNKLDINQDGVISREEFLEACQNDPNISDALGCLHTTI
ncbi:Kv channel-interacting protein [Echinococcus granulosus]|uniref:Kv channel-interacting protein n=1 Tax=Echinococcus granulosus TaxID=6210 RepID=W6USF6_ECHGR|nr:Kv channel-interacting protein [Echinococcus granulosus]EUB64203.1 Kv channel-interacting protein [Echinococcus granulosus]